VMGTMINLWPMRVPIDSSCRKTLDMADRVAGASRRRLAEKVRLDPTALPLNRTESMAAVRAKAKLLLTVQRAGRRSPVGAK
jgi:hypothetical protein